MTANAKSPLEGMLVLDLGQVYHGPYCGLLLSFMGARVLKIEPPEGDIVRRRKRNVEPYPLVMLNSNKESVVLDFKHPEGKALFLAARAPGRRRGRELRRRRHGPPGPRLGGAARREPAPRLRHRQGLRPERPLSRPARHGPHDPGHERDHERHRLPGPASRQGGARRVRLPRRRASLRRHHERAAAPRADRRGAARGGLDARGGGGRARERARRVHGRRRRRAGAHGQSPSRARHRALQRLSDPGRLRRHLHRLGAPLAQHRARPRPRGSPRQSRLREHAVARRAHGGDRRARRGVDARARQGRGDGRAHPRARAVRARAHHRARWSTTRICRRAGTGRRSTIRGGARRWCRTRPFASTAARPGRVERPAPLLGQDTDRVLAELLGLGSEELAALHARGVIEPVTGSAVPRDPRRPSIQGERS